MTLLTESTLSSATLAAGVLSPWLVTPVALLAMLLVAWHTVGIERSNHPASRKRIRTANGWVMLLAIPLVASGFSYVSADTQPRAFLLVWALAMCLVLLCVALAIADMFNTMRLARSRRDILLRGLPRVLADARRPSRSDTSEQDRADAR